MTDISNINSIPFKIKIKNKLTFGYSKSAFNYFKYPKISLLVN